MMREELDQVERDAALVEAALGGNVVLDGDAVVGTFGAMVMDGQDTNVVLRDFEPTSEDGWLNRWFDEVVACGGAGEYKKTLRARLGSHRITYDFRGAFPIRVRPPEASHGPRSLKYEVEIAFDEYGRWTDVQV